MPSLWFCIFFSSFPAFVSHFFGPNISVKSDRHRGKRCRYVLFLLVSHLLDNFLWAIISGLYCHILSVGKFINLNINQAVTPVYRSMKRISPWKLGKSRHSLGFTLVELLVVVAVFAILIMILMPALRQSISFAHRIACGSNLKKLGDAMTMYLDDNNFRFMNTVNGFKEPTEGNQNVSPWTYRLRPYYMQPVNGRYFFSVSHILLPRPNEEICPTNTLDWPDLPLEDRLGYSPFFISEKNVWQNAMHFVKPSQMPIMWDNDFFYTPGGKYSNYVWWKQQLLEQRHVNTLNYLFLDGHVDNRSGVSETVLENLVRKGDQDF
jgi:prepilin-type N-terminal cleavage/methylation domain-containing protein/prepilin-type processing-associated H-X9-DG protein